MKKINVTITTTKVYVVEFDENALKEEVIDTYAKHIDSDVYCEPKELHFNESIEESDYPFFNLSKSISFMHSEFDSLKVEGLPPIHNNLHGLPKNEEVIRLTPGSTYYEYEFDLEECEGF